MKSEDKINDQFASNTRIKKKNFIWVRIIFAIIALVVGGYFYMSHKQDEVMVSKEKIKLGISRSFLSIPIYIAQEQGYFASEGLDMIITEYPSGKLATKDMLAEEMDISTVADMPVVYNSFTREDFCIFATFTSSYSFVKMIARKDKRIETGADLNGKKIGANRGTSSHFFLATFLIHNHLSISDVEMVPLKTVDLPDALNNGGVDAISVWQPYSQRTMQLLGDNAIELPNSEIYRTTFSFAAKKIFTKERQETIEKFLRAIDKAATFIQKNKEESQDIIARNFDLDKEIMREAWDGFEYGIFLDHAFLIGLEDIARWTIKNQFTDEKEVPNYLNYIYSDALEAVKSQAVTLIH